jgi:serine/threonine protein kinase
MTTMQEHPRPERQHHNRNYLTRSPSWWERSIVKRSTYNIEHLVDTMMEHSSFVARHEQQQQHSTTGTSPILQLDRDQIQVGAMLGRGSFSIVSEVTGLHLAGVPTKQDIKEHDDNDSSSHNTCLSTVLSSIYGDDMEEHVLSCHARQYAIKHLRADLISKSGDQEHFQAAAADLLMESRYLAAFDHPGILKLRAVARGGATAFQNTGGRFDGFFIITDRLKGTLKDKILEWQCIQQEESLLECLQMQESWDKQPRWKASSEVQDGPQRVLLEKLDLALQLSQALLYLHDRRIIFRDLKPQNIGLTEDNRIQLFDFGFCRELPSCNFLQYDMQDSTPTSLENDDDDACYYMSGKGSLIYLAPEVMHNGRYNRKADCYAFAMVFLELLTLNKPFASVSNQEMFRELICRHRARPPLECFEMPESLRDLLRHSWDHIVSQRWTMRKICERLKEIIVEQERLQYPIVSTTSSEQVAASSLGEVCNGPGLMVDLIQGVARDIRLRFEHLTGQDRNAALQDDLQTSFRSFHARFRSSPIESEQDQTDEEDSMAVFLNGVVASTPTVVAAEASSWCQDDRTDILDLTRQGTADTEDCSSRYLTSSLRVTRVTPMTATEAPLEVTLEEVTFLAHSLYAVNEPAEEDLRRTEGSPCAGNRLKLLEDRCPPSPPLERSTSAPVRRKSLDVWDDLQVPYEPFPKYETPPRRSSCHGDGKGMLPAAPQRKSQRRQSCHLPLFLPEDHLMPSWRAIGASD